MSCEQGERYKSQGNNALRAKMFSEAAELYSKAIALDPNCEVYFSNRSAAHAAMNRFKEALDDAQEAIALKPEWVKGYVRRGVALVGLKKYEEARKAYLKATQLDPANKQLVESMAEAATLAATEKDKKWEDDLWSDEDDAEAAPSEETGGNKRAAAPQELDELAASVQMAKSRKRRKPDGKLLADLNRSLADSSEETLRACLSQLARADVSMAERVLQILEGLNAASSAGESDGEDGAGVGATDSWLKPRRGGQQQDDSD
uniref:Uncharacterized protein n=1 Tax=Calcidiscus leptoporus TaxID=127549 RepID=A0A7S0JC09_9EUKA|mmetsp:Transcript_50477/g.116516  ORF Transcript_50477/g.116516 Transcript_50477/m.116516 type:complete len:261 (+) Transcript_50477:24-806(+)